MAICLVPWINSENYEDVEEFLDICAADIVMCHGEISGAQVSPGHFQGGGTSPTLFKRFEQVYSGHYHHNSSIDNFHYLGAPYEITWNDYDDPRGFHVFDTETRELEFIRNEYRLFEKIYYDDSGNINYKKLDTNYYKNKIVKLIVEEKNNLSNFEDFVERLYKSELTDLTILEDLSEYSMRYADDEEEDLEVGNTSIFLDEYVDSITEVKDDERRRVKKLLQVIYDEALNIND